MSCSNLTLGPPMIYVPVCKHPRDYQHTAGPVGWERVDVLGECPLIVEPPPAGGADSP